MFNKIISTFFFCGLFPFAPGTFASAISLIIIIPFLNIINLPIGLLICLLTFILGTFSSGRYANNIKNKDPRSAVIDETVGIWLTTIINREIFALFLAQNAIIMYILSFALFRMFDIIKPFPVSFFDKNFSGGFGIMIDDVIAALMSCLSTLGIVYLYKIIS